MQSDGGSRFAGAAVLVTGGAHGIGRACAVRVAAEGAQVAVLDLDPAAARTVAAALPGAPARTHLAVPVDVTERASVDRAVEEVAQTFGRVDVLVNVAGGDTPHGDFGSTDDEIWVRMLDLNLLGVVRCCRAAIPHLRRSTRSPAIVNVSSVNGLLALGSEPYAGAKAGVGSLTQNLAASLAGDGIRVNAVAPGTIRTRVWADQAGGAERLAARYPLRRIGEPDDVAGAVAFLASTDAAWITGHTLPVDGGLVNAPRL